MSSNPALQELADKRVSSNDFGKLAAPKSRNNSFNSSLFFGSICKLLFVLYS